MSRRKMYPIMVNPFTNGSQAAEGGPRFPLPTIHFPHYPLFAAAYALDQVQAFDFVQNTSKFHRTVSGLSTPAMSSLCEIQRL